MSDQHNILHKNAMIEKVKDAISHTAITIGAPIGAGGFSIISLCEKIQPVLTVISLLLGMGLGIASFYLKHRSNHRRKTTHTHR